MKIIIVGAGRIGANLAATLSEENHEVFLIENDEKVARKADEKIDVKVVFGHGADPDVLKKANVQQADLVIAVTLSDETNLVVCSLAKFCGAKRQIARVRSPSLIKEIGKFGYDYFNIDEIINIEEVAAQAIEKAVDSPGTCEVCDFANGKILLRAFDVPGASPLCGSRIEEFSHEDFPWPFLVVAIARKKSIVIPKGDTVINPLDRIYVLLPAPSLGEFLIFLNPENKKPEKVIIYGATNTGTYVAKALSGHIRDTILLEEDIVKAEKIAERLGNVRIINGSASEKDILTECGIEVADVFIATSNNDHSNLISAVLAKRMGAKNTIIITQQPDYTSIVDALSIDAIINPHLLAVEQILRFIRGKGVSAVTKFLEWDAEALEFITEAGSLVTKAKIKEITFPKGSIIGAVCRGEEVVLVKGDTQIKAGEKVIVFCHGKAVKKLQALFINKK